MNRSEWASQYHWQHLKNKNPSNPKIFTLTVGAMRMWEHVKDDVTKQINLIDNENNRGVHFGGIEWKYGEVIWFSPFLMFICVEVRKIALLPFQTEVDFELTFQYFFYWSEVSELIHKNSLLFTSKIIFELRTSPNT